MVTRRSAVAEQANGASISVGDLVSRLVAEGRELVAVEVARGRAELAARGRIGVRAAALAFIALALALVALAALAAAAVYGIAALGLALGWSALIVGGALLIGAGLAGLGVWQAAKKLLEAHPHPMPAGAHEESGAARSGGVEVARPHHEAQAAHEHERNSPRGESA